MLHATPEGGALEFYGVRGKLSGDSYANDGGAQRRRIEYAMLKGLLLGCDGVAFSRRVEFKS